jgi:hypothetical protein
MKFSNYGGGRKAPVSALLPATIMRLQRNKLRRALAIDAYSADEHDNPEARLVRSGVSSEALADIYGDVGLFAGWYNSEED